MAAILQFVYGTIIVLYAALMVFFGSQTIVFNLIKEFDSAENNGSFQKVFDNFIGKIKGEDQIKIEASGITNKSAALDFSTTAQTIVPSIEAAVVVTQVINKNDTSKKIDLTTPILPKIENTSFDAKIMTKYPSTTSQPIMETTVAEPVVPSADQLSNLIKKLMKERKFKEAEKLRKEMDSKKKKPSNGKKTSKLTPKI